MTPRSTTSEGSRVPNNSNNIKPETIRLSVYHLFVPLSVISPNYFFKAILFVNYFENYFFYGSGYLGSRMSVNSSGLGVGGDGYNSLYYSYYGRIASKNRAMIRPLIPGEIL